MTVFRGKRSSRALLFDILGASAFSVGDTPPAGISRTAKRCVSATRPASAFHSGLYRSFVRFMPLPFAETELSH